MPARKEQNFPNASRRPKIMKLYRNVVERTNSPEVLNANYILQKKQSSLNIFEYRQTELNYEGQNMKKWLFTSNLYKVTVLTIPKNSWKTSVVQCSLSNRTWRPGKKIYVRIFPDFHDSYSQSNSSQLPLNIIFSTKLRCYTILFGELCHCDWRASHKIGKWHKSEATSRNSLN